MAAAVRRLSERSGSSRPTRTVPDAPGACPCGWVAMSGAGTDSVSVSTGPPGIRLISFWASSRRAAGVAVVFACASAHNPASIAAATSLRGTSAVQLPGPVFIIRNDISPPMTLPAFSFSGALPMMQDLVAQNYPACALYVLATPIGNAADIGLRALQVLALADAVACEDTRNTAQLLTRYGLHRPLIAAHQHNEREVADKLIARLQAGERIALVSDAGTPAVSDPGARIVDAVRAAGLRVVPVPGASAAITALSASGLVNDSFR